MLDNINQLISRLCGDDRQIDTPTIAFRSIGQDPATDPVEASGQLAVLTKQET